MLGISRWAGKGGSYRTIQRFFYTTHNWPTLLWLFVRSQCLRSEEEYALAGDEVVTTKSGEKTYGVEWFFSSCLLENFRQDKHPLFSILDWKAFYRGFHYVQEVIKLLPQKPEPILLSRIFAQVANLGAIHPASGTQT